MDLKVCVVSDYAGFDIPSLTHNGSLDFDIGGGHYKINFSYIDKNAANKSVVECDYLLVINKIIFPLRVKTRRIIALQQEPFIPASRQYALPAKNEWAVKSSYYHYCHKVFAFNEGLFARKSLTSENPATFREGQTTFIKSPPMMFFLYGENLPTLESLPPPRKTKEISCIASMEKRAFAGHLDRIKFVNVLKNSPLGEKIDFYGNGTSAQLTHKKDGIAPYKYTIAIENNTQSDYFSEKIMDAFLGYSMPIYFGAPNIARYFPPHSFATIDIYKPSEAIETISNLLDSNAYEAHFEAICEARRRVVEEYSMFRAMGREIIKDYEAHKDATPRTFTLGAYRRTLGDMLRRYGTIIGYGARNLLTNGERKHKLKDL